MKEQLKKLLGEMVGVRRRSYEFYTYYTTETIITKHDCPGGGEWGECCPGGSCDCNSNGCASCEREEVKFRKESERFSESKFSKNLLALLEENISIINKISQLKTIYSKFLASSISSGNASDQIIAIIKSELEKLEKSEINHDDEQKEAVSSKETTVKIIEDAIKSKGYQREEIARELAKAYRLGFEDASQVFVALAEKYLSQQGVSLNIESIRRQVNNSILALPSTTQSDQTSIDALVSGSAQGRFTFRPTSQGQTGEVNVTNALGDKYKTDVGCRQQ